MTVYAASAYLPRFGRPRIPNPFIDWERIILVFVVVVLIAFGLAGWME